MKATAIGYFDIGYAIGYDDTPFRLIGPGSFPGAFVPRDSCFQGTNRLGDGILLTLPDRDALLSEWINGARRVLESGKYREQFPFDEHTEQRLRRLFEDGPDYDLKLMLHSCGIVILEFSADAVDEAIPGADIIRFMQFFEYAAYDFYDSQTGFQTRLLTAAREALDKCLPQEQQPIHTITRHTAETERASGEIIPSFTLVFFNERASFLGEIRDYCHTHENITDEISFNEKSVICSWYIWGCNTGDRENREMLVSTLKLYTLYYGAAESCEKLLTGLISESMYHKRLTMRQTILLQTIGNIVVNNTSLGVATQNGEFKAIFERMDASGNIEAFHNSITRSVQVLSDIQRQLQHESDLRSLAEEKYRDLRISRFVVGITALTFISVIADLFNLDQYSSQLIRQPYIRFATYLAIITGLFFIIYKLFDKQPPDRKS